MKYGTILSLYTGILHKFNAYFLQCMFPGLYVCVCKSIKLCVHISVYMYILYLIILMYLQIKPTDHGSKMASTLRLPLYTIDAFTDTPFAGNPAAVCLDGTKEVYTYKWAIPPFFVPVPENTL